MKVSIAPMHSTREKVIAFVKARKAQSPFTVVDVGGSADSWASEISDAIVDINATRPQDYRINICNESEWSAIRTKFDFAICTHTIEDLSYPSVVLEMLPVIAKSGVITTPSVRTELSHPESDTWLGYIHHRYLVGHKNGKIILAPKLGFLEKNVILGVVSNTDIVFEWQDNIEYEILMNGYLGPTVNHVIQAYSDFIREQI